MVKKYIQSKIKLFLLGFILIFGQSVVFAQWEIPADKKNVKSPISETPESTETGKDLYQTNCKPCHGDPGMNNAREMAPKPPDFASTYFQSRTEGEIFYKITAGRGPMPGFEKILNENQRWSLAVYAKSLGKVTETKNIGKLKIKVETAEQSKTINAVVTDENGKPVGGVRINFSVKRIFGNLIFREKAVSNSKGWVSAEFPQDLPGDSLGRIKVLVQFADADKYGKAVDTISVSWAKPFFYQNPLNQRAFWGNRKHTPIWLLLTYLGVVGAVWTGILYVVFQILKLRKLK
jgi:mono/diheme cytochrome c family protein